MALPNSGMLKMSQIWAEYAAGTISNFYLTATGSTNNDWCPKNSTLGRDHYNCAISHYYGGSSTSCIVGSGGNSVITSGAWKIHKITSTTATERFTVTSIASGGTDNNLYRVITGGGGGGGGGGDTHQISGGASRLGGGGGGGQTALATFAAVAGTGNGAICGKGGAGGSFNYRGTTGGFTLVDASAQFLGGGGGGTYSGGNTESGLGGGNGGGGAGKYGGSAQAGGYGTQNNGGQGNSGGGGGGGGSDQAGGGGQVGGSDPYRYGGKGGNGMNYVALQQRFGAGGAGAGIGNIGTGGVLNGGTGGKSQFNQGPTGFATAGNFPGAGGGGGGAQGNGYTAEAGKSGYPGVMYIAYKTC